MLGLWQSVLDRNLEGLEVVKIKGFKNYYRIRKGKFRLVFAKEDGKNILVNIHYRDKIYKQL